MLAARDASCYIEQVVEHRICIWPVENGTKVEGLIWGIGHRPARIVSTVQRMYTYIRLLHVHLLRRATRTIQLLFTMQGMRIHNGIITSLNYITNGYNNYKVLVHWNAASLDFVTIGKIC